MMLRKFIILLVQLLMCSPMAANSKLLHLPVITHLSWPNNLSTVTHYSPILLDVPDNIAQMQMTSNSRLATAYVDKVKLPFRGVLPPPTKKEYQWFTPPVIGETFAVYAERLYRMGEFEGSKLLAWPSSYAVDLCHGIVLNNQTSIYETLGNSVQEAYNSASQRSLFVIQSICAVPPPQLTYCTIETDRIDFDFGILVASHAQGVSLSRDIVLNCLESVKIGLLETQTGKVMLSNGGTITLTSGDKPLTGNQNVIAQEGVNHIPIKATLSDPGKVGGFSGSTVISITYP